MICEECGCEHNRVGTRYCCTGCEEKAKMRRREEDRRRREEDRRRREERRANLLRKEKERGMKTLRKWEKKKEKINKKIEKDIARLRDAMEGDNPKAIAWARGGGLLGQIRSLWQVFTFTCFTVGVVAIVLIVVPLVKKLPSSTVTAPQRVTERKAYTGDDLPPLEVKSVVDSATTNTVESATNNLEVETTSLSGMSAGVETTTTNTVVPATTESEGETPSVE